MDSGKKRKSEPKDVYKRQGRHAIVSMQADVKRKVVALLDQVFPEYETAFTNMFSDTSMAILQTCPTPKESVSYTHLDVYKRQIYDCPYAGNRTTYSYWSLA